MDIDGLDYNTSRRRLDLPEYGREIQRMVQHALGIKDRAARQACAQEIVQAMQRVSPQMSKDEDSQHKYWDHLAMLSNFELDIDYPFDITQVQKINDKPQRIPYSKHGELSHYGALLQELFDKLKTMPQGAERDKLVEYTANAMYYSLRTYGHTEANEERVAADLAHYTDGVIHLDLTTFHLASAAQTYHTLYTKKKKPNKKSK